MKRTVESNNDLDIAMLLQVEADEIISGIYSVAFASLMIPTHPYFLGLSVKHKRNTLPPNRFTNLPSKS
jgi:hypothetical protein